MTHLLDNKTPCKIISGGKTLTTITNGIKTITVFSFRVTKI
jgi:hypothetical protein